jgi:nucleoid-associated protein YgaU
MIKKTLLGLAAATLISMPTWAEEVMLKSNHPDNHTVVKGDTLWDISDTFLQNPWMWPEIWQVNPQIKNPHKIYPGDTLSLVYVDGQPTLRLNRGVEANTVKLSPTVGITELEPAIPAIPLEEIHAFMRDSRFVEPGEMEGAPYVMSGTKRHIIAGAGDEVFGRGNFTGNEDFYGIFREGQVFTDPQTKEILGLQATAVGQSRLISVNNDVARLVINSTHSEIKQGDILLPTIEEPVNAVFQPSKPKEVVSGEIIGVESGVSQIGPMNVVIVNLGEREGIESGNVLRIYRKGENVYDPVAKELVQLPDEKAGLIMFFKVQEKLSYAIVLTVDQDVSVGAPVLMP